MTDVAGMPTTTSTLDGLDGAAAAARPRRYPRPTTRRDERLPGETVAQKFWNAVQLRGPKVALRQKELGIWKEESWSGFGEHARNIAMALVSIGLQPGDRAAILANTRREWSYADFGILCAGGVSTGIYPTDSAEQTEYLMNDSSSLVLFVEDDEQLDKALAVRGRLPMLRRIVVFDQQGLGQLDDPQVASLAEFEELGAAYDAAHPGEFERRLESRTAEDLAILVYTSGTTGKPKGAMISHLNLRSVMENFLPEVRLDETDDRMVFLPLCHIAERMFGQFLPLQSGARMNFVENPETVAENIREIAPTFVLAVPRVWEKFYSAISLRMKEATRFEQWAYRTALGLGYRVVACRELNDPLPPGLAFAYRIAHRLVLGNVLRALGLHRTRVALSGAAPISPDLLRWFNALGVPILEGWAMTETTAGGTVNFPGANKIGTIGQPFSGMEARLSPQGEILVRGANVFMGYLNLPERTAEAVDPQGWLHTGDVGTVDEDGFFRITDRMKDIIITAGGKNITPSEIENELKFSPFITDAVVIGDRRPYLTALVMIDLENVEQFAQSRSVPFSDYRSLCRTPEVQALIQGELDRVNRKFARVEQIKKFRLIETQLTTEDEELTPTMKLKRALVQRKYAELIEDMYRE
jgi:long-chain acyl-CoA synthetase